MRCTSTCWPKRRSARSEVWAYCLLPNHVHIVLTPSDTDGLQRTFGELHRRYTGYVNARRRTTGHLWQGRYGSVAMDDEHLALGDTLLRVPARRCIRARRIGGDCCAVRGLEQRAAIVNRSVIPRPSTACQGRRSG